MFFPPDIRPVASVAAVAAVGARADDNAGSGAISGDARRGKPGTPKKDSFTGPPRSTVASSVFGSRRVIVAAAMKGMVAVSFAGSSGRLPKKSKSTD